MTIPAGRTLNGMALAILFALLSACGDRQAETGVQPATAAQPDLTNICSLPDAVKSGDHKRLALIVGVGKYANEAVNELPGASADAQRIYELLTAENGYGFRKENVCLLLDKKATTKNVKEAFYGLLVEQSEPDDVAVFYFAGHGSQVKDINGDEPDSWDETLMMHDARHGNVIDLTDDELNGMFADLYAQTTHVVAILDSCNSGTATRAGAAGTPRYFERLELSDLPDGDDAASDSGDGSSNFLPESFDGMVTLSAASDGTSALEIAGRGVFTDALIETLSKAHDSPPSYAAIAKQIPTLVNARSYQIPYFHGRLERTVFDNEMRNTPLGFRVMAVEPAIQLSGAPLPGYGVGAELHVYDDSVAGSETRDPSKAKARIVVREFTGLNAIGRVIGRPDGAEDIEIGDIAVLARVGDEALKVRLGFRAEGLSEGIPTPKIEALKQLIMADEENKLLVEFTEQNSDFELSLRADGKLLLRGPENRIRNVYESESDVVDSLWRHGRQRALMLLRGEVGSDFVDHETLKVQLIPAARQSPCATGNWVQADANEEQVIPLCHAFNVKVELSPDAPEPGLLIGAVLLSTDGQTYGLPADGRKVLLGPGETMVFNARNETITGGLPLDTQDRVMVFGTQEENPVPWHLLTQPANTRAGVEIKSGLHRVLDMYVTPGTRGFDVVEEDVDITTWTMSAVVARVEANSRFLEPDSRSAPLGIREYTLPKFNIAPYLPDDENSALFKVLTKADWLANSRDSDGFDYKQHDWSKSTDAENLQTGIDCSRAIWFAFTRSGLPYNSADRYLTTSMMVAEQSSMSDEFSMCPANEDYQLGDILVYRSDERQDGHVVMVVDAAKRIAWGSHGWDGSAKASDYKIQPDKGVEYQLIKVKQDWKRWDRQDMQLKACWRYDRFVLERRSGSGLPGVQALETACDAESCRM